WQGQLVSSIGDVAYEIALGFWILAVTGSTALMGGLMAASTLPRVILSPFAGVWVDRADRKWLIVLMDAGRGVAVLFAAAMAILGLLQIWMVFVVGVIIGIGAAFFGPSVSSVIPDLVEKKDLVRANSGFAMIRAGSGILGNSGAGVLYATIGAPLLFLINGLSYLASAVSELFMRVPRVRHQTHVMHFWEDMRSGLTFVWNYKGLRFLFLGAAVINFFASISFVLMLPLFQRTAALGPGRYGATMAVMTFGMFAGMIVLASMKVPAAKRLPIFSVSALVMGLAWMFFPISGNFLLMLFLVFVGGVGNAVINVFIDTITQLTVPQQLRGKVYGLLNTLSMGLMPIAMGVGGVLGQFLPIRSIMVVSWIIVLLIMAPMLLSRDFRNFLKYDPDQGEAVKA
ncbi:MAG TPA: MFS transporter, partial [Spirochaetia bacterium]|nr:MFS transporter [Spirochaetia bacterium]